MMSKDESGVSDVISCVISDCLPFCRSLSRNRLTGPLPGEMIWHHDSPATALVRIVA